MAITTNEQPGVPAPSATGRRKLPGNPASALDNPANDAMSELFPTAPSRFQEICEGLRALYLADPRPWLVGFSGGKDSGTDRNPCFLNPSSDTPLNSMLAAAPA